MDYLRTALPCGTALTLGDRQYLIKNEVGRGGSCIVYDAEQIAADGTAQIVRIKELYPAYENISRNEDNSLNVPMASQERFESYFQRSRKAFAQNQQFRTTQGLINSTIDTTELYRTNGTVYTVMRCVEGCDYGKAEDDSIKSVLTRVLALAKVLKKYHENSYLHLDVKPENVFIIPETKEHIVLFDFDSLISFDELKSGNVIFSTSDGYTAPEVLHGQIRSIGVRADFYAVGALVYNKIFGESPKSLELNSKIDYSAIKFPDNRYQPLLFQKLSAFFRKTISVSPVVRYRSDDELIQAIEQLIGLSDVTGVQLISNFGYDASTFVGRTDELVQISEAFDRSHIVFLSGIGGIGKTELAKKYVKEHLNDLNRVVFCYYNDSIENAVCDSIQITECEPASGESRSDYFKRKLKVMKGMLTEQDIIIIDNFDVSSDENLDELLKCPCKFLITTREDFSQYDYEQVYVDCFADIEDAVTLFTTYDRHNYDSHQQKCVKEIIELLERHTMTVELAAKYLDDSDILPSELLESLKTSSGITAADSDIEVSQRKDGKRSTRSITAHLLALFNMSGFSSSEKELIGSLSLMGNVFVSRKLFLEKFCSFPGNRGAMNKLIKTGWVKYDPASGRISLHQVIMDLVYNSLRPDATSCPAIIKAMGDYAEQEIENSVDSNKRDRLVSLFLDRITGNDNVFAAFLLKAFRVSKNRDSLLDTAEQCCDDSEEGIAILREIYTKKLQRADARLDDYGIPDDADLFGSVVDSILDCARTYIGLCERDMNHEHLIENYIDIAWKLENMLTARAHFSCSDMDDDENANRMLDYAVSLFDKAEELIVADNELTSQQKIDYLRKIRSFFIEEDYNGMELIGIEYRVENYTDTERAEHYLSLINSYKDIPPYSDEIALVDDIMEYHDCVFIPSNDSTGESYGWRDERRFGNYERAVQLLEQVNNSNDSSDKFIAEMVDTYLLAGRKEQALQLAHDYYFSQPSDDDESSCEFLIAFARSCEANGLLDIARELCLSVIEDSENNCKSYAYNQLEARYILFGIETNEQVKSDYWNDCVSFFDKLDLYYIKGHENYGLLVSFILEYAEKNRSCAETVEYCYNYIKNNDMGYNGLAEYVLENSVAAGVPEYRILLCLHFYSIYHKALELYNEELSDHYLQLALSFLQESDVSTFDEYLLNLIYRDLSNPLLNLPEYAEKCDFYLIGEYETANMSICDSLGIWEQLYHSCNNESKTKCRNRIMQIIDNNLDSGEIQACIEGNYYFYVDDCSRDFCECGDYSEAVKIYAHGIRNIISFFSGSGYNQDFYYVMIDSHNQYEILSDIIYRFQMDISQPVMFHKIISQILSAIILLEQRYNIEYVSVFENPTPDGLDSLYAELEMALNLPDSSKYVNTIWEKYAHLFDKAPSEFQRFAKLFEDYFARNSTDAFDFKQ